MPFPIYAWFGTTPVRVQVDATGHLQVDILSSALPAGAATAAAQATQLTALQKLDDLQDALESKALDRLLVRGMDQHFSYKTRLCSVTNDQMQSDNGLVPSATPPAGTIWHVTAMCATNKQRPTTQHRYMPVPIFGGGMLYTETAPFAAFDHSQWTGHIWMENLDTIRVYFIGGLNNDNCRIILHGHTMTLET